MPWLTIIIMVLQYLMSSRNTPQERRQAVLRSVLAGGITYATTHYTDWGKENLGQFDGAIEPDAAVKTTDGSAGAVANATKPVSSGGGSKTVLDWFKAGLVAVGGAGVVASAPTWGPMLLIGLAVWYFFIRDDGSTKVVVAGGDR